VACSEDGSVASEVTSLTANDDGAGMTNTFMELCRSKTRENGFCS
jgi:hypothetical protein